MYGSRTVFAYAFALSVVALGDAAPSIRKNVDDPSVVRATAT